MTDLSKLVKRAERAMKGVTPGPWHIEGDAPWNLTVWSSASNRVCFMAHSNGLNDDRDMATGAFIASARELVEEMTESLTTLLAERDASVARAERAEGAVKRVIHDIDDLVANSEGVAGLHMNGEVADWQSIMAGGSFGAWLESVEDLRAALPADANGGE